MREGVIICQNAILYFFSALIFATPIVIAMNVLVLPNVGLPFMLIYSWVITAEMFMVEIILEYMFKGGFMFKFIYYMA